MSIKQKLLAGFSTMILITLIACTTVFFQLKSVDEQYSSTLTAGLPQLYAVSDIRNLITLESSQLQSYLIGEDAALQRWQDTQSDLKATLQSLNEQLQRDEAKQILADVSTKVATYEEQINKTLDTKNSKGPSEAASYFTQNVLTSRDEAIGAGAELNMMIKELFEKAEVKADDKVSSSILISTIVFFAALVLGMLLTFVLYRLIAIPLQKLKTSVQIIATGNLTEPDVQVKSKDEIGELTTSFNLMKNTIKQLISSLGTNAEHLSASAKQLSASTQEMTHTAEEISIRSERSISNTKNSAASAKECAVAMDETTSAIQRVAESSQSLHSTATDTTTLAGEGEKNVSNAKQQMQTIYASTKLTTELIQKLSQQSTEIENISHVITGITDQTNLLSLNAAIEAARAGEHGKGFAVVADEVRKLAEASKQSANQIVELTSEIQHDTKNVEKAIQESLISVEHGVDIIEKAGNSFNKILVAVDHMKEQIEDVSAVTEQISAASEEVSASVQELASQASSVVTDTTQASEAIHEQIASMQEINNVTSDLNNRAEELQNAVMQFKV